MAVVALALNRRIEEILDAEKEHLKELPDEERAGYKPTKWFILAPTDRQTATYRDMKNSGARASAVLYLLGECLDGWEHFVDETGKDIPSNKGDASRLRQEWRYELAGKIDDLGDPDAEDFR